MRTFTRAEFHELVWTKPMTTLAKEFALSDVALHKVCRKHNVPTPPVGWWAKHAAGKSVQAANLISASRPLTSCHSRSADATVLSGSLQALPRSTVSRAMSRKARSVVARRSFSLIGGSLA